MKKIHVFQDKIFNGLSWSSFESEVELSGAGRGSTLDAPNGNA